MVAERDHLANNRGRAFCELSCHWVPVSVSGYIETAVSHVLLPVDRAVKRRL